MSSKTKSDADLQAFRDEHNKRLEREKVLLELIKSIDTRLYKTDIELMQINYMMKTLEQPECAEETAEVNPGPSADNFFNGNHDIINAQVINIDIPKQDNKEILDDEEFDSD